MAWVMDTYSMHVGHTATAVVTGKPVEMGGSLGRREATGRGVMIVTREAAKHLGIDIKGATVAIQGFGNVGSVSAELLAGIGAKIVARHRLEGRRLQPEGPRHRSAPRLRQQQHRPVDGFPGGEPLTNEELFALDVDVLMPAALENQITDGQRRRRCAPRLSPKAPTGRRRPRRISICTPTGVFVIPDILANAGGVTTSYFEWVQDRHGYFWEENEVNTKLERKMCEAFDAVLKTSLKYKVDMRTAAYIVAIERVGTVTKMRGMYA